MLFGKKKDKEAKAVQQGQATSHGASSRAKQFWDTEQPAPSQGQAKAPDAPADENASLLLAISRIDQLEQSSGQQASGKFDRGWLWLGAGDGGRSVQSFPAAEGELFTAQATLALLDPGRNNIDSRFFFGPIFFDADGKVLLWWKPFNKPGAEPTDVAVETRAPEGTTSVKLGISGSWDSSGSAGDYVVGFANARLLKRSV